MNQVARSATPANKGYNTGVLRYLLDQRRQNTTLQEQIDTGDGTRNRLSGTALGKGVEIRWYQRSLPSDALATLPTEACPTGTERFNQYETVAIDSGVSTKTLKLSEFEVRALCESQDQYLASALQDRLTAATKRLNEELATTLAANIGTWADADAVKEYALINATDYRVNPLGESAMKLDLRKNIFSGMVDVIGEGNWFQYITNTAIGGLQDSGVFTNRLGDFNLYFDTDLPPLLEATNNNHALIMESGASALVTANAFLGQYARSDGQSSMGTIVDPNTGLRWDIKLVYDKCGGDEYYSQDWNITCVLPYKLWTMPEQWSTGDELDGTTGIFEAEATAV